MLSLAIIWNSAYQFKNQIISDMNKYGTVLGNCDILFSSDQEYSKFVYDVYFQENMEKWKIDKKLAHMLVSNSSRSVNVVFMDVDITKTEYHPQKKILVYKDLNDLKVNIRDYYSQYINNYCFDIVIHATDDEKEFSQGYKLIRNYLKDWEELKQIPQIIQCDEGYQLKKTFIQSKVGNTDE